MFEIGEEYARSRLLTFVGSKQPQSGILWGPKEPGCVIVTAGGKHSESAGYEDRRSPNGSWHYFGQGEKGDQALEKYANKLLMEGQRSVLLFTTREPTIFEAKTNKSLSKLYRFEGIFGVRGWEICIPEYGPRAGDKLLLFHLIPIQVLWNSQPLPEDIKNELGIKQQEMMLVQLRNVLIKEGEFSSARQFSTREYRLTSAPLKIYARLRANGICEYCNEPAPFVDIYGLPFLEVHHIRRLADDGPDIPKNVAALCPNCHREAHFGNEPDRFRAKLAQLVLLKEQLLDNS
jgi:5-methylcytosine-specific restriction protein A